MREIKRILLPFVFSEHDVEAAGYARQFAMCAGAEIDLIHVTPEVDFIYGHEMALQAVHREFRGYQKEVAEKMMGEFAEKYLPNVHVRNMVVVSGNAANEILNYANKNEIDMIAIASFVHCREGLESMFVGSVAERVIKRAAIPVLVVHPPCSIV